ncbi:Putative membrane protein [Gloeomargarita lithophora Alchichica-D10]|uniref:Membrane protein n=1 Tax=Gloeomargarita lithophora Alchichica-D10 TaxID=1188229 RepID=A0A1J0AEK5_9CYAN|nr:NnrU family protein [Gloeomargarita lithophora]APB34344.1 Putative membrane protein [Gloeomargarita lithophora Alchichica-D10]
MSHGIILGWLLGFALVHSGLAALRPQGEKLLGARGYRVLFASASLLVVVPLLGYFLKHRYDGVQLWQVQDVPGVRALVWGLTVISFGFLFPATFNLGEISAIQKPQIHLYFQGIIRISRHPQMVGQILWCLAHTLWIGSSFMVVTSLGLIAHHIFGVWHGERRWAKRFPEAFPELQANTSIIPFQAIIQGKQKLVLSEFLRPAYAGVVVFVSAVYWLHPQMWVWAQGFPF